MANTTNADNQTRSRGNDSDDRGQVSKSDLAKGTLIDRITKIEDLAPGATAEAVKIAASHKIIGDNTLQNDVIEANAITAAHDAYVQKPLPYQVWTGQADGNDMDRAKAAALESLKDSRVAISLDQEERIVNTLARYGASINDDRTTNSRGGRGGRSD